MGLEQKGVAWKRGWSLGGPHGQVKWVGLGQVKWGGWHRAGGIGGCVWDRDGTGARQDLVAWVTVGFLHIPHSEDVPNTATPGNAVGFFLRPFNFFDEDPSMASRSPIIVRPLDPDATRLQVQRWTPASPGPCVAPEPFHYNGTYREE